jgi:hypothetical protein
VARRSTAVAVFVLLVTASCGTGNDPTLVPPTETGRPLVTASIDASDQTTDGTSITVAGATIAGIDGWVVVHRDADGAPGPIVGRTALPEGTATDLDVTFDEPVVSGDYWPMVHIDAGAAGTFEFPDGGDVPVTDEDGDIVMVKITLTVE